MEINIWNIKNNFNKQYIKHEQNVNFKKTHAIDVCFEKFQAQFLGFYFVIDETVYKRRILDFCKKVPRILGTR